MAAIKQPPDKSHFILPDLGEGVHEAELIRWRVKPGDTVEEHQTLAEMETDKALVEVPSPWAGVIKELHGDDGDIITVGSRLVTYDIGAGQGAAGNGQDRTETGVAAAEQVQEAAELKQRIDEEEREDAGTVVGSVGGSFTISERFARARGEESTAEARGKALATPAVRRIAREKGIDINAVSGSGRGGRVTATDLESFLQQRGAAAPPARRAAAPSRAAAPAVSVSPDGVTQRIPFRGVRRRIAEALDRSIRTAVHFTVVDEADVTALQARRREYGKVLGRKLSLLPFVMTAACEALRRHPALNANVDDEKSEILIKQPINLGCAVDTDHGLMVPVIPNAGALSLVQLADAVRDAAESCRNRTIEREKLVGGTFTVSNVGAYGGMFATPIINYPEVAILAVGRVKERVLTKGGMFYAGSVLPLSLSCDHRVVDGAEGARFLNTVVRLLENPSELLGE